MQQSKAVQESELSASKKAKMYLLFIAEGADYSIVIPEPLLSTAPLQQLSFWHVWSITQTTKEKKIKIK